jgi:Flp pilus assembly protein TadD
LFNAAGSQKEVISSFEGVAGTIRLSKPQFVATDEFNNLVIYDAGLSKVIVKPINGKAWSFGEKGSKTGQFDKILGLAVDGGGYIYVLHGGRKQVDIYTLEGNYLTWISGGLEAFIDPIAIGVNGKSELHVLERGGPDVIVFDALGNFLKRHRALAERPGASLTKPVSLAVLRSGDFFILDEASCVLTQYDLNGMTIGTLGSRGDGERGTFIRPVVVCANASDKYHVAIYDAAKSKSQVFRVLSSAPVMRQEVKRPSLIRHTTWRPAMVDMITAPNGFRYAIQSADKSSVVAYRDSSASHVFTLSNRFKEAVALATDKESNLYVVDRKAREVLVFDTKGVLVRRFGGELPGKLKDPTSIVIQSSGTVIVSDAGAGTLHAWNTQGVYQKALTTADNAKWKSPFKVGLDSRDQIYVWDNKNNCVYRVGSNGWPVAQRQLRARGVKPRTYTGVIGGMLVDAFDQVHLYNKTNGQLEVYQWENEPVLRMSKGKPGNGPDGFGEVASICMDRSTFYIFMSPAKGAVSAWHFMVKPPTPSENYTFDAADGKLIVFFEKLNLPYVEGYALLGATDSGKDTLLQRTSLSSFTIDNTIEGDVRLKHYKIASISPSNISDATEGFDDYYTWGNQLLASERYDEALLAFQSALDRMGRAEKFVQSITTQLTSTGKMLAARNEVNRAMAYLRLAYSINPENPATIEAYQVGYAAYFREMVNREDMDNIIEEAERLMVSGTLRMIVLNSIDSLSIELRSIPNESSVFNAIVLQKKLIEWDPVNPSYTASLASAELQLYRIRKNIGSSSMEQDALLADADRNIRKSISDLKRSGKPVFEEELTLIHVLNAQRNYEDAEYRAVNILSQNAARIPKQLSLKYRYALCDSYEGKGRFDLAAMEYRKILEGNPQDLQVKLLLAEALINNRSFDDARQIYLQLLLNDRNNADYIAQIGRVELLRGNYAEASFQLERAIQEDPSDRSYYGPLGEAFDGANNYQKAIDNYDKAISFEEHRMSQARKRMAADFEIGEVQYNLEKYLIRHAALNDQIGKYTDAIRSCNKLIELNPANAEAHYNLGIASLNAGLIYDAEKALNNAARLDASNEVYSNAHANAVKQRAKIAASQPALNVVELNIYEIYPSLYRNYADVAQLPIGEVVIANNTDGVITPTSISVFVKELMDRPTQVSTPAMVGYSNSYVKLSAIFQDRILKYTQDQPMQIDVEVQYTHEGKQKTAKKSVPFTLRSRNSISWSDKRRLAAFVAPGTQRIMDYNREVDKLFRDSYTPGLNRNILKALQLFTVLNNERFSYTPDPLTSFATASLNTEILDNLQFPMETLTRKQGDCDDFVAMYAALLENAGISSAYVDVPGHVFMAFDTQIRPSELAEAGLSARDVIIQQGKVWLPVETTLIGTQNFMIAWKSAADRYYRELQSGNFPELVPLADARKVYLPSSYTPEGFSEQPVGSKELMKEYDRVLASFISKSKREIIRETESRYQSEPGNVFVKNKYAILLAQTGERDRAEGVLLEAYDLSPQNPSVLNNLGNLYYLEGRGDKAVEYYLQAAEADKRDAEIRINLCKAYLLAGNKVEARTWLNKAIELEPGLDSLYDYLKNEVK